jgi:hypothetical protein
VLYGLKDSMNSLANKIPDKNELHHSQFKLPFSNANEKASLVAQRERAGIVPSSSLSHVVQEKILNMFKAEEDKVKSLEQHFDSIKIDSHV